MGNNVGNSSIQKFKKEFEAGLEAVPIYSPPDAKVIQSQSRRPTKQVSSQNAKKIELDAEPIQGKNEKLLYVDDGRRQVLDTAKWPNSVHGVVAVEVNGIMAWGTGIMVGPRVVLTAGHNLYDFDIQIFHDVKTIRFLPGMNGKMLPFGAAKVERYFVSPNYVEHGKQDYGILILKEPIGEMTGYFGLACLDSLEDIKGKKINVTGYPADKVAEKANTYEMWGMEGEAREIDQETGHINYLIDTGEGQNGGGVWYKEGEEYYVCGVHRGTQFANQATLLTRDIYKQIYAWLQEASIKDTVLRLQGGYISFKLSEVNTKFFPLLLNYNLDGVEGFHLWGGKIGNQELKILAQKNCWFSLSHIDTRDISLGDKGAKALGSNTSWENLERFSICSNSIGAEGAKALAQNASWVKLSLLDLSDNKLGAEGAKALAQNTSWVNLTHLCLQNNQLGVEGASALAQNTSWIKLLTLEFYENEIGAEGARRLAQNTSWINLSMLSLHHNDIETEGAKRLARNTSWVKLAILDLSHNNIGAEGAGALAQNTSWTNLSRLELEHNCLGTAGVSALAQNTSWINLSHLGLSGNSIGVEGMMTLAQNKSWTNLSELHLRANKIEIEGARALASNTSWINLSVLGLSSNALTAEAVKALAGNTSWVNLTQLKLDYNNIGEEGGKALASNTSWIKLTHLHLAYNKIGLEGAKGLASNTSWVNLSELHLTHNNLETEGAKALAQNKSWINLSLLDLDHNNITECNMDRYFRESTVWKKDIKVSTWDYQPPPVESDSDSNS